MTDQEINELIVGDYIIWLEDSSPGPGQIKRVNKKTWKMDDDDLIEHWQLEGDSAQLYDKDGNLIKRVKSYEIY